jgi:hypothetical protein
MVLLSLSNTVQNVIIGDDNSVSGGVIGAFGLLAINWLVVRVLFRSTRLTRMLEGVPRRRCATASSIRASSSASLSPAKSCRRSFTARDSRTSTKCGVAFWSQIVDQQCTTGARSGDASGVRI